MVCENFGPSSTRVVTGISRVACLAKHRNSTTGGPADEAGQEGLQREPSRKEKERRRASFSPPADVRSAAESGGTWRESGSCDAWDEEAAAP